MSQNRPDNDTPNATGDPSQWGAGGAGSGGAGTGATDAGTTRDTGEGSGYSQGGLVTSGAGGGGAGTGAATGTAAGIAARAKEYGQSVAGAATTAKDYLSEKASVVGDKFQDLRNKDYSQIADEAKDFARQKPGQALLVAAAAGFVIGLLLRGGRR